MPKNKRKSDQQRIENANKNLQLFARSIYNINLGQSFLDVIDVFLKCRGKIVTTGMGKAGIAMMKFSATLCSVGFPSCYLHPGEASHGDLGLLSKGDILFVASTSGKTREIIEIIHLARNIGIKTIVGITSHKDSPLREMVDYLIDMGEIKEAGHLSLAPTTSILVMSAITDVLALSASEEKGFTKSDYAKYHHSGYCGMKARGDANIF
jgi:arabinose-5-phosphate isomerase